MDGEREAQSLDFDAALALHLDTLTRELAIQVRKVYRSWRLPLDTSEIEHEVAGLFVGILEARRNYDPLRGSFKAWANKVAMCRLADRQRQFVRERDRLTVQYESSYASEAAFDLLIEYCATSQAPEPPDDQVEVLLHAARPPSRKGAGRHPSTVFQRGRIRNDRARLRDLRGRSPRRRLPGPETARQSGAGRCRM